MPHDSSHVRTLDQVLHATRAFCSRIFFYPAFYVLLSNNREPYTRSRIDLIYVSTASAITECVLSTLFADRLPHCLDSYDCDYIRKLTCQKLLES